MRLWLGGTGERNRSSIWLGEESVGLRSDPGFPDESEWKFPSRSCGDLRSTWNWSVCVLWHNAVKAFEGNETKPRRLKHRKEQGRVYVQLEERCSKCSVILE